MKSHYISVRCAVLHLIPWVVVVVVVGTCLLVLHTHWGINVMTLCPLISCHGSLGVLLVPHWLL